MLNNTNVIPSELARLQDELEEHRSRQNKVSNQVVERLDTISAGSGALISHSRSTSNKIDDLRSRVTRSICIFITVSRDITHILRKLQAFSRDVMEAVAING